MRYRAKVHQLYEGRRQKPEKWRWGYTDAASINQAKRYLIVRYPYPQYFVDEPVPDPRTGIRIKRIREQTDDEKYLESLDLRTRKEIEDLRAMRRDE